MTDIRTVAIVGYVLKTLDPYLDQEAGDEEIDQVYLELEQQVPQILAMTEDELYDYVTKLWESLPGN